MNSKGTALVTVAGTGIAAAAFLAFHRRDSMPRAMLRDLGGVGELRTTGKRARSRMAYLAASSDPEADFLELGAGTGDTTQDIVIQSPTRRVFTCEKDEPLLARVRRLFASNPLVTVFSNALQAKEVLDAAGVKRVVIISYLPWTSLAEELRDQLMEVVLDILADGGTFVVIQYSKMADKWLRSKLGDDVTWEWCWETFRRLASACSAFRPVPRTPKRSGSAYQADIGRVRRPESPDPPEAIAIIYTH